MTDDDWELVPIRQIIEDAEGKEQEGYYYTLCRRAKHIAADPNVQFATQVATDLGDMLTIFRAPQGAKNLVLHIQGRHAPSDKDIADVTFNAIQKRIEKIEEVLNLQTQKSETNFQAKQVEIDLLKTEVAKLDAALRKQTPHPSKPKPKPKPMPLPKPVSKPKKKKKTGFDFFTPEGWLKFFAWLFEL